MYSWKPQSNSVATKTVEAEFHNVVSYSNFYMQSQQNLVWVFTQRKSEKKHKQQQNIKIHFIHSVVEIHFAMQRN